MKGARLSTRRNLYVAAFVAGMAIFVARPREAHAQIYVSCDAACNAVLIGGTVLGTSLIAGGLATDVAIAIKLATHHRVERSWALWGTVLWSIDTVATTSIFIGVMATGASFDAGPISLLAGSLFSAGSLALSVYALIHPTATVGTPNASPSERPASSRAGPRLLGLGPMVVPSRERTTVGAVMTLSF